MRLANRRKGLGVFVTWLKISRDMVLLECDGDMKGLCDRAVGRNLFDVYPDAVDQFGPGYRLAFELGHHNFATMYHDCIVACLCTRVDDHLLVCSRAMPLNGLTESLAAVEAALAGPPAGS